MRQYCYVCTGLGALIALVMHISYKRNGLIGKEGYLHLFSVVGALLGLAGLAAFAAYLITAIIEKQGKECMIHVYFSIQ